MHHLMMEFYSLDDELLEMSPRSTSIDALHEARATGPHFGSARYEQRSAQNRCLRGTGFSRFLKRVAHKLVNS